MAKAAKTSHLLELARRGAEVRARFLAEELRLLLSAFPHLKDAFDPDELPVSFILKSGAESVVPASRARTRKPMSAAARKAVGERMRLSWSARRAAGDK